MRYTFLGTRHTLYDYIFQGGNDYEIYSHEKVKGNHVNNPDETIEAVYKQFLN